MKLSIFTPTHNPQFLPQLWETIKDQPGDWEWVIVYNGDAEQPPKLDNSRIKHFSLKGLGSENIGRLKQFACSKATGDILVEVDHDDLLSSNTIEKISDAFKDPKVGFAYSDFAEFHDDTWKVHEYGSNSGWKMYPIVFQDHHLLAHEAFEPDARAMSSILFAPNHVRAWRRSVYEEMGGHRIDLSAGDDHELVCRTYLHTKMVRIPECLYFYRRLSNGNNSYLKRNELIQRQENENRNKYMYPLVERWCDLENLKRIDLGSSTGKPDNYTGVDIQEGADVVCDVRKGLPFEDSSVGIVRAVDFLEHIVDPIALMNEIYRVLAPGGWLLSLTPSTDGRGAFCDPTHVSFWNDLSFRYYCNKEFSKFIPSVNCRFQPARLFTYYPSEWHERNNVPYVCADLVAIKYGYRPPGIVSI